MKSKKAAVQLAAKKEKSRFRRLSRRICRKRRSILRRRHACFIAENLAEIRLVVITDACRHFMQQNIRMVAQHLLRGVHAALRQEGVERRSGILAQQARQVRLADANIGADTRMLSGWA